jgi:hypothetical protein
LISGKVSYIVDVLERAIKSLRVMLNTRLFWSLTLILRLSLITFLILSPGKHSTADDISNFFGGTEFSDWCGHIIWFTSLAFFEIADLQRALEHLQSLKTILNSLGLMGASGLFE